MTGVCRAANEGVEVFNGAIVAVCEPAGFASGFPV
jgi:hypothetical protein